MLGEEFGEPETDRQDLAFRDKSHVVLKEQVWPWPGGEIPE